MFLPTTPKEIKALGWQKLDVILITGDAYIDSPFMGICVIGKILIKHGFKVGIIAQPDINSEKDILRLGEPALFWGVTSGSVDSMIANYTPLKKKRKKDDFTPGGINNRRPDRALIVYANLIRRFFKNTCPIVLGGIEASLRRIAHYDFWSNKIRRSILFDAKADILVYGMAEKTILDLATTLQNGEPIDSIKGLGFISKQKQHLLIPSFQAVSQDKSQYIKSFHTFYENNDPITAQGLCQKHGDRYLVLNPPGPYPDTTELDAIYDLDFERDLHPFHKKEGEVRALETIRFSVPIHQGCYGECNFCAIAVHQGRTVRYRSETSILKEAKTISELKEFKGYILDLSGPTANMYGFECQKKLEKGACNDKRCLFPKVCKSLKPDHSKQIRLIKKIEKLDRVKKVFISSGIRYDLILNDTQKGDTYLKKIVFDNVSGQMKVAPEHTMKNILTLMGKQDINDLLVFKKKFDSLTAQAKKKQFLTYYLIAAHPGCQKEDMKSLKKFTLQKLNIQPEQVQIFTPSPSTYSTLMYYTGINPFDKKKLFVAKNNNEKETQKKIVTAKAKKTKKSNRPHGK
ncbi:MAG: YgiQ family radical SAM protein [Desulfobacteraceae bacterium]|nr:YgiQ family radical SAM protein [Desulfobacteraceae bacterium]